MWMLDCEGDALSGRKLWLKPGSEYVVGRSVNALGKSFLILVGQVILKNQVNLVIPQKSISRLHLKIKVGEVPKGNGVRNLILSQPGDAECV